MFASFDGGKKGEHGYGRAEADGQKVEDRVHEELSTGEDGNGEDGDDGDEVAHGAEVHGDGVGLAHGDADGWGKRASVFLAELSVTCLLAIGV